MGAYVDPPTCTKERWLSDNHVGHFDHPVRWEDIPQDCLMVVLVDAGTHTAAGIAFDDGEHRRFTNPLDTRPKSYYLIERQKLYGVSNLEEYLPQRVK